MGNSVDTFTDTRVDPKQMKTLFYLPSLWIPDTKSSLDEIKNQDFEIQLILAKKLVFVGLLEKIFSSLTKFWSIDFEMATKYLDIKEGKEIATKFFDLDFKSSVSKDYDKITFQFYLESILNLNIDEGKERVTKFFDLDFKSSVFKSRHQDFEEMFLDWEEIVSGLNGVEQCDLRSHFMDLKYIWQKLKKENVFWPEIKKENEQFHLIIYFMVSFREIFLVCFAFTDPIRFSKNL
jgi:hypothetical protein